MAASEEAEAHKLRGNEFMKAGKMTEAIEAYSLAIEVDPANAVLWNNRSAAHIKAGDASSAVRDAMEAVRLRPTWVKAHHRYATALEASGNPHEAARACRAGLDAVDGTAEKAEVRELERLNTQMVTATAALAVQGWWHGTVSAPLGGYEQEFHFMPQNVLQCVVYGDTLEGTYAVLNVEENAKGGLRGGLDVTLNSAKVPFLFRLGDGDGILHLCCPMTQANERPRTFDGLGYVAMSQGRIASESSAAMAQLRSLSEGKQIISYLDELLKILLSKPESRHAGRTDIVEKLEDSSGVMNSSQLFGPETLEDKSQKLAAQQRLAALKVKYSGDSGDIVSAAERLIKGEVDVSSAYPAEASELKSRLRYFQKKGAEDASVAMAPKEKESRIETAPSVVASSATPALEDKPAEPPAAKQLATAATLLPPTERKPHPKGGCWQGCFAWFHRPA